MCGGRQALALAASLLALGCSRPFVHTMVARANVTGNQVHFVVRADRDFVTHASVIFVDVSSQGDGIVLVADDPDAGGEAGDRGSRGSASAHFVLGDGMARGCDAAGECVLGLTAFAESRPDLPLAGVGISLVASFPEGTPPAPTRLELVLDGRSAETTTVVNL